MSTKTRRGGGEDVGVGSYALLAVLTIKGWPGEKKERCRARTQRVWKEKGAQGLKGPCEEFGKETDKKKRPDGIGKNMT